MAVNAFSIFSGSQALSFYGFLLPWLFTFAIVFGLLTKANIFGDASKKVNVALAFVIAFFVTGVGGAQLASFFVNLFGGASVFLAGILVFLLFITLAGVKADKYHHTGTLGFIFLLIVAAVLWLSSSGTFAGFVYLDAGTTAIIFWVIVLIAAAYLITKDTESSSSKGSSSPKKD